MLKNEALKLSLHIERNKIFHCSPRYAVVHLILKDGGACVTPQPLYSARVCGYHIYAGIVLDYIFALVELSVIIIFTTSGL